MPPAAGDRTPCLNPCAAAPARFGAPSGVLACRRRAQPRPRQPLRLKDRLQRALQRDGIQLSAYRNITRGEVAECNWLQSQENACDPMHTFILHSQASGIQFTDAFAVRPDIDFERTPISVRYMRDAELPNGNLFHRVAEVFVPNTPAPSGDCE